MTQGLRRALTVATLAATTGMTLKSVANSDVSHEARTAFSVAPLMPSQGTDGGLVGWGYDLANPWPEGISGEIAKGFRLMRTQVQLGQFRDRPLDEAFLASLSAGFDLMREQGGKAIVRFVYNLPQTRYDAYRGRASDAPLARVLEHIEQLGPVLARHSDVIAWFEGGFVGTWGEWHTSTHDLDSTSARDAIKAALLEHFPRDRQILFRYPADVRRWYPRGRSASAGTHAARSAGPLSDEERVGLHNDCFLSTATDGNTYPLRSLREFAKAWNRGGTAFGGETCEFPPWRMNCRDILNEGPGYSLNYLNGTGGNREFEARWREQGCFETVRASIGPRIELHELVHPSELVRGVPAEITVDIRNAGWSRIPNRRELFLTLVEEKSGAAYRLALAIDSDDWLPAHEARANGARANGADETTADPEIHATQPGVGRVRLVVPESVPPGRYAVALESPDPAPRLANDVRYALRFANADVADRGQRWAAAEGRFVTGRSVTVE